MATVPEVKRNYYQQDLRDWCKYAGVELRWPDTFPLRTVLPLRVTLVAACDPKLIKHLCELFMQHASIMIHNHPHILS